MSGSCANIRPNAHYPEAGQPDEMPPVASREDQPPPTKTGPPPEKRPLP